MSSFVIRLSDMSDMSDMSGETRHIIFFIKDFSC